MIKFERTEVMNVEAAIRGMRNPLNSWDKSDSDFGIDPAYFGYPSPYIGPNDLALAQKLIKAGSDHRKFMRQIFVSVDITAPLYWWKEFDTYKVATVANSCSTMHTIHKKPFTLDDFSAEDLDDNWDKRDRNIVYGSEFGYTPCEVMGFIIDALNKYRDSYLETNDKKYWRYMIQMLPTSYNQKRTITLNYETLRNIYGSRRNHKLDEWSVGFMNWIDSLPYAEELIKYSTKQ